MISCRCLLWMVLASGGFAASGQTINNFGVRPTLEGDIARLGSNGRPINVESGDGSPVIVKEGSTYYMFTGGAGILVRRSADGVEWDRIGSVLPTGIPAWAQSEWGAAGQTITWAPDISYFNGRYHLYYAVSELGLSNSAIGFATTLTLDPASPQYGWVDHGSSVLETNHLPAASNPTHYNAIDPNVVIDQSGDPWLVYGSYWSGIKLQRLNASTGGILAGAPRISLAQRTIENDGTRAVEAPFIIHRDPQQDGGWYYLFTSFDPQQTAYNIRVGRSRTIDGTYVDFDGVPLMQGGGTLVLSSYSDILAPGHNGIYSDEQGDWLVHHYRDLGVRSTSSGEPVRSLMTHELIFGPDAWPVVGEPHNREALGPAMDLRRALLDSPWRHATNFATDDSRLIEFLPDGTLTSNDAPTTGSWSLSGRLLTLTWTDTNPLTPDLVERVTLQEQARWFVGRDLEGTVVQGLRLRDPQIVAGDFNADGTVDTADYVLWRDGLGTFYTQNDYEQWRTNFGYTAAALVPAVSIPEPSAILLALLTVAGALARSTGWCS